jgi:hypothetical protein
LSKTIFQAQAMEEWKSEDWKIGRVEGWESGRLERWSGRI